MPKSTELVWLQTDRLVCNSGDDHDFRHTDTQTHRHTDRFESRLKPWRWSMADTDQYLKLVCIACQSIRTSKTWSKA